MDGNSSRRRCPRSARLPLAIVALAAAATLAVGCGEEESSSPANDEQQPYLSVAELQSVLEREGLALVRTGGGDDIGEREGLVQFVRYEDQSDRELELWVWRSPRIARQRLPALLAAAQEQHGENATAIRAANAIVVFPARPSSVDAYRAAARAMSRLGAACIPGGDAEERLRRLCFGGDPVPPAGEGVARDETEEEGDPIAVGGLHYDALLARILNPNITPDSELVSGRRPPEGKIWFGVFVRVCNEHGETTRTPTGRLALVDAFGARRAPHELPENNVFDYEPRPIEPEDCLPREGSVAAQVPEGALVLFAVSRDYLTNRPIALEVVGEGGQRRRVVLDI